MRNEVLSELIRTIDITSTTVLKENEVLLVHVPTKDGNIDEFIILLDNGVRVGGIYIMGDFDVHIYTLEEHRNKGYMSKFFKSRILNEIRPKLTSISCEDDFCYGTTYPKVQHLAEIGDFHFRDKYSVDREVRPSQKKDIIEMGKNELEVEMLKQCIEHEKERLRVFVKVFDRANQINEHFSEADLCYSIVNHFDFNVIRPSIDFLKDKIDNVKRRYK